MQRMGGGGSRKYKKNGGGNDPRCGCDMTAGWPKALIDNIPLPSQKGGGCSATACAGPLVPGQIPTQYGGGCGCAGSSGYTSLVPGIVSGGGWKRKTRRNRRGAGLLFANGGGCGCGGKVLPMPGGLLSGGGCPMQDACPFAGTGYCSEFYAKGGGANGCGCLAKPFFRGGYKPTKRNRAALRKLRQGKSIGFTMTSSLKAKGLIPRTSRKHYGKKIISKKYQ